VNRDHEDDNGNPLPAGSFLVTRADDQKVYAKTVKFQPLLNAFQFILYDAEAEKVVKGTVKLTGDKLSSLLAHLNCTENELPNYGYYPTAKKGEYLTYETESDLRDTENVPLKESIYNYFLREVKPHVDEAWINLDATKIGYEISFNKYFYQHKPLRAIEAVTADILALEKESDGLIAEILGL
jgi:type I restriction enzyme M protein